jgi:hemin uptake protein HemP
MADEETSRLTPGAPAAMQAQEGLRVVPSDALLMGSREIIIRHGTEDYRLRLTRAGKLILNK